MIEPAIRVTRAIAPGKAILCGEYAVLEGAPAVAVAVDRVVRAEVVSSARAASPPTPFICAAFEHTRRHLASLGASLEIGHLLESDRIHVDSSGLYDGAQKLGFGSSAAVTVATVGLLLSNAGQPLEAFKALKDDRELLFRLADEAHAEAQGTRGSGIDVATAIWGGAISFCRRDLKVAIEPLTLPAGVQLTFVFTGKSASTPHLIGRVRALAERDPIEYRRLMEALRAGVEHFLCACRTSDRAQLLAAVSSYHEGLAALGRAADTEIVTAEFETLASIAARAGGAAKPSGAGGGDLGVAFTFDPDSTARLARELEAVGLKPLPVGAPAPGLRLEIAS